MCVELLYIGAVMLGHRACGFIERRLNMCLNLGVADSLPYEIISLLIAEISTYAVTHIMHKQLAVYVIRKRLIGNYIGDVGKFTYCSALVGIYLIIILYADGKRVLGDNLLRRCRNHATDGRLTEADVLLTEGVLLLSQKIAQQLTYI